MSRRSNERIDVTLRQPLVGNDVTMKRGTGKFQDVYLGGTLTGNDVGLGRGGNDVTAAAPVGPQTITGAASLTGLGVIVTNGFASRSGAASLTGAGVLTAAGTRTALGAATLTGSGILTAAGVVTHVAEALLDGTGVLTVDGVVTPATPPVTGGGSYGNPLVVPIHWPTPPAHDPTREDDALILILAALT